MGFDDIIRNRSLSHFGKWVAVRAEWQVEFACMVLIVVIAVADYFLGKEISLSAAYLVPIFLAAWFVGPRFALFAATSSTIGWSVGNILAGQQYSSAFIPVWNFLIRLTFYGFMITILIRLNRLQTTLEVRAEERAVALAREIGERERVQHDMLQISEREQRRIGQDLHDGLCQHLTGTALASYALAEKLAECDPANAASARRIVDLIEEAIELARGTAKGLHPVELQPDGLMQALEEFAYRASEMFGVRCNLECNVPVLIHEPVTATHLYRIAQEGVSNAIKHGRATDIVIVLEEDEQGIRLSVQDNGKGFPDPVFGGDGMGLRIMDDRAKIIGGHFSVMRRKPEGSELICVVPRNSFHRGESHVR